MKSYFVVFGSIIIAVGIVLTYLGLLVVHPMQPYETIMTKRNPGSFTEYLSPGYYWIEVSAYSPKVSIEIKDGTGHTIYRFQFLTPSSGVNLFSISRADNYSFQFNSFSGNFTVTLNRELGEYSNRTYRPYSGWERWGIIGISAGVVMLGYGLIFPRRMSRSSIHFTPNAIISS